MARGVNKVIIIGNLGAEPDVKQGATMLRVATSESWKDKTSGEQKERTEWHRVVCYGRLAEIAGQYLHKGSKVYLEGSLRTQKWTDKAGIEKYTTEIISSSLQMLDGKEGSTGSSTGSTNCSTQNMPRPAQPLTIAQQQQQQSPRPMSSDAFDEMDDIPF